MSRPRLLDLFCGAGGAAVGYHRAGFEVVGVDIAPQPNYPFEFVQADALELLRHGFWEHRPAPLYVADFAAIHASPPCQFATDYQRTGNVKPDHPNLIPSVRVELADYDEAYGIPFVIENVGKARTWLHSPLRLCGSMFDLDVQRHRYFESSVPLRQYKWPCRHKIWDENRYPGGRSKERHGDNKALVRRTVEVGSWDIPLAVQKQAMGIDWEVSLEELSEAIPPDYTEFIGYRLMQHLTHATTKGVAS